ncbi:hypothetical protein DYB28_005326 [Aphanomyces astaci]|uniref:Uncharacterized protein n=1 Tax=Aphanomyces astaci TaxID=112090 RepID=A0A397E5B0_APHAT|nr:hypothetical protein DYB25_010654 [Aphanomyces astaci]RHY74701.1 hypothetical protein DYB38_008339 [Aphanomyces astaci]RHY75927.1 hypothetical protein DYB30_011016 [Aphanomyces astaci]RHY92983.1 hypothetical protein DYB26_003742 [Aphanomyces astaci]RLO05355.1 hypothetical protein DYB28_005326 [Aphanomyces astaci]
MIIMEVLVLSSLSFEPLQLRLCVLCAYVCYFKFQRPQDPPNVLLLCDMSDATTNDKSFTDLKFNGRKATFTAWKVRIIAHLNSKSTEDDYKRLIHDKKPLNLIG